MAKYAISKQGNKNLVMGRDDVIFYDDLAAARREAQDRASRDGIAGGAWFVFEVEPRLMFSYRPQKAKEEDWSDTSK